MRTTQYKLNMPIQVLIILTGIIRYFNDTNEGECNDLNILKYIIPVRVINTWAGVLDLYSIVLVSSLNMALPGAKTVGVLYLSQIVFY
jgi:hypothetical protein